MHVTKTSETQSQPEQLEPAAPSKGPSRKSILALSVFALGLNATAAVYTMPSSDFELPDVSSWAGLLLGHQEASASTSDAVLASFDVPMPNISSLDEQLSQQASAPKPDTVVAALRDIQSAQQQQAASLKENSSSLQQNTALLRQDSNTLASLRQSITDEQVDVKKISAQIKDEHVDVKKISAQISTLIAKVDTLQNAIAPEITSSISKGRGRNRLSVAARKRMARQTKPVGPVSIGGARLSVPATTRATEG
jgi:hypothetical protein